MSDDITFCLEGEYCRLQYCERHPSHIADKSIPHSYAELYGTELCLMSRKKELKPCPFCGATAEINKRYPPFGRRVRVTVRCTKCKCNSGEWGRRDKAIEAWNRRASDGRFD